MYIVINEFTDLKDNKHKYNKNDIYPYEDEDVDDDRLLELSSTNNLQKKELIKQINFDDLTEEQLIQYAKIKKIKIKKVIQESIKSKIKKNNNSKLNVNNSNEKDQEAKDMVTDNLDESQKV